MIFVDKGPCPQEIQEDIDAQKAKDGWNEIPEIPNAEQAKRLREEFFDALDKTRIRTELLKRQHGLCVYCMTRVENDSDSAVIEHLYPLSKSKQRALQYANLFVSCRGGEDRDANGHRRVLCCDAKKEDSIIQLDPLNKDMMDSIVYYSDGRIDIAESYGTRIIRNQLRQNLQNHLGLNGKVLNDGSIISDTETEIVKGRRDAYKEESDLIEELEQMGELTQERIDEEIENLLSQNPREDFVGVKLFVLSQTL